MYKLTMNTPLKVPGKPYFRMPRHCGILLAEMFMSAIDVITVNVNGRLHNLDDRSFRRFTVAQWLILLPWS